MTSETAERDIWGATYLGAGDPADLFYNVGVTKDDEDSPYVGTNTVSHFYYGLVGEAFAKDGRRIPIPGVARWAVQLVGDDETAARIWRNRVPISDVVAARGGQARVRVEFDGDQMTITEYDWTRWSQTVPALP